MLLFLLASYISLSVLAWGWYREVQRRNRALDGVRLEQAKLREVQAFLRRSRIQPPIVVQARHEDGREQVTVVCGCAKCLRRWASDWAKTTLADALPPKEDVR